MKNRLCMCLLIAGMCMAPLYAKPEGPVQLAYQWEFNTPGDTEGWVGADNGHTDPNQATSINGIDGVLTSTNPVTGNDPQLLLSNAGLTLDARFRSWGIIEIRVRQLSDESEEGQPPLWEPQTWDSSGAPIILNGTNLGVISSANYDITDQEGEWIVVNGNISNLGAVTINNIRLDPIGGADNVGNNYEVDYIRLYAALEQPELTVREWAFDTAGDTEGWVLENDGDNEAIQATSINGIDDVLTSDNPVTGGDPWLYMRDELTLDAQLGSWGTVEIRVRQLNATGDAEQPWEPQPFESSGTTAVLLEPFFNLLPLTTANGWTITTEPVGEWIVARGDMSGFDSRTIEEFRFDPIGTAANVGNNWEVDYIRLTGLIPFNATNPTPADGLTGLDPAELNADGLSWNLSADPNLTGSYVYVAVGDPDDPDLFAGVTPDYVQGTGSLSLVPSYFTFDIDQIVYWRVDTQIDGSGPLPGDPNTLKGTLWSFETQTSAPVVESFDNVITAEALLPATLSATISHLTDSVTSVVFTTDDPNVVLLNQNTDLYEPTIEVDLAFGGVVGTYTITLTVTDENANETVDTADVAIYENACLAAQAADDWAGFSPYDFNEDCTVNLMDFAELASEWLDDRRLQGQETY